MRVGLIDVDGHNFPNLAIMKISAYHKSIGDEVEWYDHNSEYDVVYQSKVFDDTYSKDINFVPRAKTIIKGGTGYGMTGSLPDDVEHIYPDYSIYPELTQDTAYGFLTRGCPRHCEFCIVGDKEGLVSRKVADLSGFWNGQKYIKLLDPNILACKDHIELLTQLAESKAYVNFTQGLDIRLVTSRNIELLNTIKVKEMHFAWDNAKVDLAQKFKQYASSANHKPHGAYGTVYVLVNFNSTMEENLYRIYTLVELGFNPYVMIYDKPNAPQEIKHLQRWCNSFRIRKVEPDFKKYKGGKTKI